MLVRRGVLRSTVGTLGFYVAIAVLLAGCAPEEEPIEPPLGVRPARVLLFDSSEGCEVCVNSPFSLDTTDGRTIASGDALQCVAVSVGDGIRFGDLEPVDGPVTLSVKEHGRTQIARFRDGKKNSRYAYPGAIEFSIRADGSLRVINLVDIESYIGGVVACEASSAFGDESLKGQAVAARTYAMYIMARRSDRPYDLRASEGAQVYRGWASGAFGRRTRRAVEATRGLVLSHATPDGPRVFCAYYSSACGGRSQSLSDVQNSNTPEPLRGGVECDYCSIAKKNIYRWGPNEIKKSRLLQRLKSRRDDFDGWTSIASVRVVEETEYGRVRTVALTNKRGKEIQLRAEHFRLAVGSRTMRSTDCEIIDDGKSIRITDGRGFGHGLGLCQWGMEGLARQGRLAGSILRYYYPGSRIVRAF
ncbi:MAG: hypothetical protein DHS20C16_34620 [Phycisphaerae bacterium]|nr:MAG: hypothetical protein DHS20C16_34620 [Phycisphaerae bacterium]